MEANCNTKFPLLSKRAYNFQIISLRTKYQYMVIPVGIADVLKEKQYFQDQFGTPQAARDKYVILRIQKGSTDSKPISC